ncbi:MAG TPA: RagB/SusD family nutrient uptake outer membrane protein [Chitinophagaceae bacterium]|nr:RagB/SusD family nutrient uptake outer membrane protein [Chitinophagaceae bacterium]
MRIIKQYLPFLLLVVMCSTACKKYVDVTNPDTLVDPDYWKNENSVRTYSWEFYNMFVGFGNGTATNGDFYFPTLTDDQAASTFTQFPLTTAASNGDWSFTNVRKANVMLERIDGVDMSDEAKNHWKGIARFFRALQYFRLVQTFGGVPFFGSVLEYSDTSQIYKPRDSRQTVMDNVLADLNFAAINLRQKDQDNTVNKDIALALKSRVCLFEGTYRKYHTELSLPDADKFLLEAKTSAEALMASTGYTLSGNYQATYNSDNLSGNKEVLLYKRYETALLQHSLIAYNYSSTTMNGMTKAAVESYVATDGLPIGLSPLYQGDADIFKVVANRDKRLKLTVDTAFLYYNGHFKNSLSSSTGYRPIKFLPADTNRLKTMPTAINTGITDAPLFWLAEVYLNYAEASAELDQMGKYAFTQNDLDISVNKLRARAGVAKLEYAGGQNVAVNGTGFIDPKKDADVTSLIWEIRRERRSELMMDGFRFQDLMRWKKGKYLDTVFNPDSYLGAKVPANGSVRLNAQGYIMPYVAASQRSFTDPKNYLSAVPTSQILLYPPSIQATMQNPGW